MCASYHLMIVPPYSSTVIFSDEIVCHATPEQPQSVHRSLIQELLGHGGSNAKPPKNLIIQQISTLEE